MKRCLSFLFMAVFVFFLLGGVAPAKAGRTSSSSLTVSPHFGSHMVLQRDMVVPVFGAAAMGSTITVTYGAQSRMVTTPSRGKGNVDLAPMNPDDLGDDLVITNGSTTITGLGVILVGVVVVFSARLSRSSTCKASRTRFAWSRG